MIMFFTKKSTYKQHHNENTTFYRHSAGFLNITENNIGNLDVDICIIGGGLTGISSALNLKDKANLAKSIRSWIHSESPKT